MDVAQMVRAGYLHESTFEPSGMVTNKTDVEQTAMPPGCSLHRFKQCGIIGILPRKAFS